MNIFRIIVIIFLLGEILGTFYAFCNESEDCHLSDVIILITILVYVILN